jgi:hypothetical protein
MNEEQFTKEYKEFVERAIFLSEKACCEGLLKLRKPPALQVVF